MKRWDAVFVFAFVAAALFAVGLFVPAHLRAVDRRVVELAGQGTPTLASRGVALVREGNPDAARMILQFAREQNLRGADDLEAAIASAPKKDSQGPQTITYTEFAIHQDNREAILGALQNSSDPVVRELLKLRDLTNTVVLPPSASASGQAMDAAIAISGSLVDKQRLSSGLSVAIVSAAREANDGKKTEPIETALMDLMSLGQRFTWGQLAAFLSEIPDTVTLHRLAGEARSADAQLPALFSAVELSGNPTSVSRYVAEFSESGLEDLKTAMSYGSGGLNELLNRDRRLYVSPLPALFVGASLRAPLVAVVVKWFLYVSAGFLFGVALHFARPTASELERPLQVRGFHYAREFLFSLGFLLVVLLVSEPFLAQDNPRTEFRFQLRLPTAGGVVPMVPGGNSIHSFMNQEVLLTMLLFFVLQVLLYVACVVKLAEIRRQRVGPRMKLKLLENEEHLFDAGLYLGFFGTIVSLILVSLGVFKQPSLMAAYSSTSFGILFVSFFKIVHLRGARRKLLLEADAAPNAEPAAPAAAQTYAVS